MVLLSALLLTACESEDSIVSEMERSLYASQGAVAAHLVATEVLTHTFDEPDTLLRHGDSCGCPCTERIGSTPPFVITLDYQDTGCLPESGIVPTTLAGHAVVDWDGTEATVTFDALEVGLSNPVSGSLSGIPSEDGSLVAFTASIDLGSWKADIEGSTNIDDDGLTLDASTVMSGPHEGTLDLSKVQIDWSDVSPPCPAPSKGKAMLAGDKHDVEVGFAKPGDGFVTVTRKNRVSESIDYCGYRTDLF